MHIGLSTLCVELILICLGAGISYEWMTSILWLIREYGELKRASGFCFMQKSCSANVLKIIFNSER